MNSETLRRPEETEVVMVQCEVCLKEVPASGAASAEGRDYVLYFCGTDCYEQWFGGGEYD